MSPRLAPGGRELISQQAADIAEVRAAIAAARSALAEARRWNDRREPLDVARYLAQLARALDEVDAPLNAIAVRTHDDLEVLLARRESRGGDMEARIAAIEQQLAELQDRPALRVVKGG